VEADMTTITITLPDERARQLKETATQLNVSPEELVRLSIEDLLTRPGEAYDRAAEYVLKKNAELYKRLA
jgi:antitoxin FitA